MKLVQNSTLLIAIVLGSFISFAQNFEGSWTGAVQGLPLVFEISQSDGVYTAKMQSPKQSKTFLPVSEITVDGDQINMSLASFKINYTGKIEGDKINGTFSQGTFSTPMVLEKKAYVEEELNRPQEPKPPYPYSVEEVVFKNPQAGGISLAGTLTLPNNIKNPPVAILISGSGPQDRNEELLGHKPFLVIAHHLTQNGIAVLRYDDRGVAQSEGTQKGATSADFATDVEAAISYLKSRNDVDQNKIGLIGHSEGGLIAPIVIANKENDVAFFISLAGPGVRGDKVLLPQLRKSAELAGANPADLDFEMKMMQQLFDKIVASEKLTSAELNEELKNIINNIAEEAPTNLKAKYTDSFANTLSSQFSDEWMRYFLSYDPTNNLSKVTCPVLAINGSLDYQVIPEINLDGMKSAFAKAKNKDVTIKELPGLNHLFQNATTGSAIEYETIEETFDPAALELMSSWINQRF